MYLGRRCNVEKNVVCFFFSSRRRHTRWNCDWSSDVCSSDLQLAVGEMECGRPVLGRGAGARDGSGCAVERVAGLGEKRLAGAGEPDSAGESREQRDPEFGLEIMDLLGEGGLGDVPASGSARECEFLG